ncbi:MAG: fluoride efflux transporter CrcB [Paludisphaera borealis]|uniref:fluoride efflux transporter CrcB n=1 Tax=Paludisphaera borealis TaxID=1387353 RepID=UPI002845ED32|nr:fluoride efflux transporter CrcB [Paludisphaera borealis]MDR3620233.1 fluoride efflux transporter CrcB [Paludisphaera borealis]
MEVWTRVISLSIGGVLGVNARYWLGVWMSRWAPAPWATFTINISGSFAIGFLSMTLARWLPHPHVRLLILTGFLGGYTTFSTWAFESAVLWDRGEKNLALVNLFGSLVVGMAAALAGMALARDVVIPARERAAVAERPQSVETEPRKGTP